MIASKYEYFILNDVIIIEILNYSNFRSDFLRVFPVTRSTIKVFSIYYIKIHYKNNLRVEKIVVK